MKIAYSHNTCIYFQAVVWNMKALEADIAVAGLGGFAYAMHQSPVHPGTRL